MGDPLKVNETSICSSRCNRIGLVCPGFQAESSQVERPTAPPISSSLPLHVGWADRAQRN